MFELLFKYPASLFHKGQFVLLAPWPLSLLLFAILAAAGLLFWHVRRNHGLLTGARPVAIWLLETGLVALVLFLLWHPALSVATLKPQQNVIAVLVDDSRSMAQQEGGSTRLQQAESVLDKGLLSELGKKFQVRLYRFGRDAERIPKADALKGAAPATRIGDSLKQVLAESTSLPLGAMVLLSDGADNSGGIDLDTISQIRRQRVPVHTVGFGREKPSHDIEISDVTLPARAQADARLSALVTFRQYGMSGQKAHVTIRDGNTVLASRDVTLKGDGAPQTESLMFNAGAAGARNVQVAIDALPGEENRDNNSVSRLINVDGAKRRILYFEGEPRWEFKFIRRAADDDRGLQLVSMLRTTQNKIYYQGGLDSERRELEQGFPAKAEDLFKYQALIFGSNEVGYFTQTQQELIKEFANRRGGGVLFLGGRFALSEGGWPTSPIAEMMPVRLLDHKGTFHRDQSGFELTAQGRDSVICRLEERSDRNDERWKKMPLLANFQEVGEAKPGAVVLIDAKPSGMRKQPLLAVENYGRGRTSLFATAGSWRWKMLLPHEDTTHATFWQQLLRYLVAGTPTQVSGSTPHQVLSDETTVHLRAEIRGKDYKPLANAKVEAHVVGPGETGSTVELKPQPLEEGVYVADWTADRPGNYVTEIVARNDKEEIGRDVVMFRREDGVAENFHATQNRELLEKLAEQTGGRYYSAGEAAKLSSEISYSEAGITTRETRDLWDMPVVFLLALMLRGSEWMLRRKWGVV
jgi:uncharacterized membrane protein